MAGKGGKGRTPKPTHLKILQGDEERRINREEPEPEPATLLGIDLKQPPSGIGARAAAVWRRLAPDLIAKRVLTTWDVDLFAAFCQLKAEYDDLGRKRRAHAKDSYQRDQFASFGSQGQLIRNPYMQAQREVLGQMMQLASRFGLSPADRAGLVVTADPSASNQPGAERLIN